MILALVLVMHRATISYVEPAKRISLALPEFGKAIGRNLEAGAYIKDEIITLRLKDADVETTLAKIADTFDATWKSEGNTMVLTRTNSQIRDEEHRERDHIAESMAYGLAAVKKQIAEAAQWNEDSANELARDVANYLKSFDPNHQDQNTWKRREALEARGPFGSAAMRIVSELDPKELALVTPGHRVVWSSAPTSMQRAFPPRIQPFLNQLGTRIMTWHQASVKYDIGPRNTGPTSYSLGGIFTGYRGDTNPKVESLVPSTVLLTALSQGFGSGLNLQLKLFDAKGRSIGDASRNLAAPIDDFASEPAVGKGEPNDTKIDPPEELMPLKEIFGGPEPTNKKLPPLLVDRIMNPDRVEPLSIIGTPVLMKYAEATNQNLIGNMPDTMIASLISVMVPMRVSNFRKSVLKGLETDVAENDGWMIAKPLFPIRARRSRCDRRTLKDYLALMASGVSADLDKRAFFALKMPDPTESILPMMIGMFVSGNRQFNISDGETDMLRFYGSLDAGQRSAITAGIPLARLTGQQIEIVLKLVYSNENSLGYSAPPSATGKPISRLAADAFLSGILREPTEALPNGLPPDGYVKLVERREGVVVPQTAGGNGPLGGSNKGMNAQEVAWTMLVQSRPDLYPDMNPLPKNSFERVDYATRRSLAFEFQFTDSLSLSRSLNDLNITGQKTAWKDIPDSFRNTVETALATYRKSLANAKPGQRPPGAVVPPL